jgi:hypothetical protein
MSLSAEAKRAYQWARSPSVDEGALNVNRLGILADWGRHERAMRLRSEFWRLHDEHDPESCLECDSRLTVDNIDFSERHNWTDEQWEQEVDRELTE